MSRARNADAAKSLRLTLAGLVTAAMAFALMQTFLIPALPRLQEDLHTSGTWVTWTVTAYLLTGSVATPIIGRLGDQHGKVKLMIIALAIFLVGSIGAIFAWSISSLIVWRAVQGVGGAVFPLSFAIIRDEFPKEKVSVAMGLVSAVLGVGGGVGIVASGLIIDNLSWRYLFVVSAIVVAVALVLVWRFVPDSRITSPSRVDLKGAVTLSAALICLLVGLTEGQQLGWGSSPIVGLFGGSVALFLLWGFIELRVTDPMVDMRMMARRVVLFTNLTAMLSGFALYMTWVILPTFYELPSGLPAPLASIADYGFGTSVTVAGLWILPTSLAVLGAGPLGGLLGRRYGERLPLVTGMLLVALGSAGHRHLARRALAARRRLHLLRDRHRVRLRRHAQADRRQRAAHRDRCRHGHEHGGADGRRRHRGPGGRGAAGRQRRPGHQRAHRGRVRRRVLGGNGRRPRGGRRGPLGAAPPGAPAGAGGDGARRGAGARHRMTGPGAQPDR